MPQLVKKRRSGWAVLAVGALVASILAVGASPAAAAVRKPDFESQWKACLGPALVGNDFSDVSMDSVHYENINCLDHYGITVGKGDGTFDPEGNVTRSQMALFLARAADAAGIDLGDATANDFTDVNADDEERADAINRLVDAGIMFGDTNDSFDPPSTTLFAPTDHVTRWEMAVFLFAFLDHALDSVMVDVWPPNVDGDSSNRVELGSEDGGRSGTRPDDHFGDARRQTPFDVNDRISAIYELGITTGLDDKIGVDGVFNPNGLVTRAQMASLVMRTMGHTNLRPAGLSAQSTDDDTQVSVRDADFVPIPGDRTEVFTTNFPDDAFNVNGACIVQYTQNQDPGFDECQIDVGDRLTSDDDGNALWEGVGLKSGNRLTIPCTAGSTMFDTYTFMSGTRGADTDYTIFAWKGGIGDTVSKDDLVKSSPANVLTRLNNATKAVVTGGVVGANSLDAGIHVPMGRSVTFTVQLRDEKGRDVGPSPEADNSFNIRIDTYTEQPHADGTNEGLISGDINDQDTPDTSDDMLVGTAENAFGGDDVTRSRDIEVPLESGQFQITIGTPDYQRHRNNRDTIIRVFIAGGPDNELDIIDMTGPPRGEAVRTVDGLQLADVRFSDNGATVRTVGADAAAWRLRSPRNRNSIAVTVHDQYGNLYRVGDHEVQATDPVTAADFPGAVPEPDDNEEALRGGYLMSRSGRRSIGYTHNGTRPLAQIVTLQLRVPGTSAVENDPDTLEDEAADYVPPVNVGTVATEDTAGSGQKWVTVYWANRGGVPTDTSGDPILLGDPAANFIIVDDQDFDDVDGAVGTGDITDTYPVAYSYGDDDKFVVEGEVVSMDQFEEILAQHGPLPLLIADLGTLSWVGYDFNRPRDGATWSIDGLSCREAPEGD